MRRRFGAFAKDTARGLALRHDHGSQSIANDVQKELRFLGSESSPAFVRAPEGNGSAERFIGTLKENLLWMRSVDSVEDLRVALLECRLTHTTTWLVERHDLQDAQRRPPPTAFNHGSRRLGCNSLSHQPRGGVQPVARPCFARSGRIVTISTGSRPSRAPSAPPAPGTTCARSARIMAASTGAASRSRSLPVADDTRSRSSASTNPGCRTIAAARVDPRRWHGQTPAWPGAFGGARVLASRARSGTPSTGPACPWWA